jgi:hypothetical protein
MVGLFICHANVMVGLFISHANAMVVEFSIPY